MERNGISKLDLKRLNRMEILRLIIRYGPMSRIDIAHKLNLTRAAVTIITNDMIAQQVIYEKGEEKIPQAKPSRGRKKILLDINENHKFSFGIVIDRQKVDIGLANLKGQTLDKSTINLNGEDIYFIVDMIYSEVERILENNCLDYSSILGIAGCLSNNAIPLFQQSDKNDCLVLLKKLLVKRFQTQVIVEGTTESLAIAESIFNTNFGDKPHNMVFVRYGYDLDAAIMIEGRLYHGANNKSGWFAHLVVETNGMQCECGKKGCCITKLAFPSIIERIKELYSPEKTPVLYQKTNGNRNKIDFSVDNFASLGEDEAIRDLFSNHIQCLTTALHNIFCILDPDKIILFGFVFEKLLPLDAVNQIMEDTNCYSMKDKMQMSSIPHSSIHLAGNGLCVKKLFINKGGFETVRNEE